MAGEAPNTYKLGPGTLKIGDVGSEVDYAAQITGCTVAWDKDKEDDVPVLSGGSLTGDTTYTATLSANLFQDLGVVNGLVEFSWANKGTEVAVTFVPSTAAGRQVTGTVIIDPIDVGGEEAKGRPRSDIEWAFVGEPALTAVVP
jgi:hypothetical protein